MSAADIGPLVGVCIERVKGNDLLQVSEGDVTGRDPNPTGQHINGPLPHWVLQSETEDTEK